MKFTLHKRTKAIPRCNLLIAGVFASPEQSQKTPKKSKKEEPAFLISTELQSLDKGLNGHLFSAATKEGFLAKEGQIYLTGTLGQVSAEMLALYGLGVAKNQDVDLFRRFAGDCYKIAQRKRASTLALMIPEQSTVPLFDVVQALIEGVLLSSYSFDRYHTKDKNEPFVSAIQIYLPDDSVEDYKSAEKRAEEIVYGVTTARDLINECAKEATPEFLAKHARAEAEKAGLAVEVFDEKFLKKEGMNLLLAVAAAAEKHAPPRVVRLHYKPQSKGTKRVIALVGKGVTFDTGGLDLKNADGMLEMKNDMSGAAAVLGTMLAIAKLKPKVEVVGYLGCVENAIGPSAYHPGDIFHSRNGLTVEINNTDAEGRLVLADVMSYTQDHDHPDTLIDVATLTGACIIALGPKTAGLFSNDDNLSEALVLSGKHVGESFWRMPLLSELRETLKSSIADMKNTGDRYGGAITAALFLKEFVAPEIKWAHLDIAGPAVNSKPHPYLSPGGVGFSVRTLVDFVMSQK